MSKDTSKRIALGAIVAGFIGFIAGILSAPKSGDETRQDIKNNAAKARRDAEKKLKEIHSRLHAMLIDIQSQSLKLSGQARKELDNALDSATTAKEKVREVLSAIHDGDADDPDLKKALHDAKEAINNLEKYLSK